MPERIRAAKGTVLLFLYLHTGERPRFSNLRDTVSGEPPREVMNESGQLF